MIHHPESRHLLARNETGPKHRKELGWLRIRSGVSFVKNLSCTGVDGQSALADRSHSSSAVPAETWAAYFQYQGNLQEAIPPPPPYYHMKTKSGHSMDMPLESAGIMKEKALSIVLSLHSLKKISMGYQSPANI